jgi:hypothetical protein
MPRLYVPGLTPASHKALNHYDVALNSVTIGGHASRHAAGGTDALSGLSRSQISDLFNSPFWNNIPDKPASYPPSAHASTHAAEGADAVTIKRGQISDWNHVHDGTDAAKVKGVDPTIMQAGTGVLDNTGVANITFPTPFPSGVVPKVFVSSTDANSQGIVLDITNISNTGFTVKGKKVTGMVTDSQGNHTHQMFATTSSSTQPSTWYYYRAYLSDGSSAGYGIIGGGDNQAGMYVKTAGAHTHTTSAPAVGNVSFTWLAVNL